MREIKAIVVHCSATPNGQAFFASDIDQWHKQRGWKKIGYHFVIDLDGTIEIGRPVEEIGAHVEGANAKTIGICMIGTDRFTQEQWQSLATLHDDLSTRFPMAQWYGHRDFSPDKNGDGIIEPWEWLKTCPGFDVRDWEARGMAPLDENIL